MTESDAIDAALNSARDLITTGWTPKEILKMIAYISVAVEARSVEEVSIQQELRNLDTEMLAKKFLEQTGQPLFTLVGRKPS